MLPSTAFVTARLHALFLPYILAHELTHIQMEHEARQAGHNRNYSTTNVTRERMIRSISDHVYKLRKMGLPEADITKVTLDWVNGLATQLFNIPLDIVMKRASGPNCLNFARVSLSRLQGLQPKTLRPLPTAKSNACRRLAFIGQTWR